MKFIAFVCGHNSGRSQMAQAAFNILKKSYPAVDANYRAISWGTGIGSRVNPKVVEPMARVGVDMTDDKEYFPKTQDHPLVRKAFDDVVRVFTMGCMDNACALPGGKKIDGDWALNDPAKDDTAVIAVRDAIFGKCLELIATLR